MPNNKDWKHLDYERIIMNSTQILLLCICGAFFIVIAVLAAIGNLYSLKRIPNKPVGNGQHGTARFATRGEVTRTSNIAAQRECRLSPPTAKATSIATPPP